jgi:hypothetical protein
MLAVLFYGKFRYPHGVYKCSNGISYCGKQAQPHTAEEYDAYHNLAPGPLPLIFWWYFGQDTEGGGLLTRRGAYFQRKF